MQRTDLAAESGRGTFRLLTKRENKIEKNDLDVRTLRHKMPRRFLNQKDPQPVRGDYPFKQLFSPSYYYRITPI